MSRSQMPVGLMLIAALAIGGVLAVGAAGAGGQPQAASATCSVAQLSALYVNTSAGAGSRDGEYGFTNNGAHPCTLRGYPRVQMLTSSGAKLATVDEHAATGAMGIALKTVKLVHGASAYFDIHYAAQTGFGTRHCPTSAALELTAPGQSVAKLLHGSGGAIQPYGGSITHLECGILHVTPLSAKRFQ